MKQESEQPKISWVGVFLGLVFLAGGIFGAYGSSKMIVGFIASANWEEVPAELHEIKLKKHFGETTTYSVQASYSYRFKGTYYTGSRVSLSSGSDNLGTYWQDLAHRLRGERSSNEASALVNPNNPTDAILDRTLRWRSMIFGGIFLLLFGGVGVFVLLASLSGTKNRNDRLEEEHKNGIPSDQRNGRWIFTILGVMAFLLGTGLSFLALSEALPKREYLALFVLLFPLGGLWLLIYALKQSVGYRRFGPTPLFLDPSIPGVGGDLGGTFSINASEITAAVGSNTELIATLTCIRRAKANKTTSRDIIWQHDTPVYLKQSVRGADALFLFEIPQRCHPTGEWTGRSGVDWNIRVKGDFKTINRGVFERTWQVTVEDRAAQASHALAIPENIIKLAKNQEKARAVTSANKQIPIAEDSKTISLRSSASRGIVGKLSTLLFGLVFLGTGVFTVMQNWWPGYFFVLVGSFITLFGIYYLGKSIDVTINKNYRTVQTQERWFGFPYAKREAKLSNSQQFELKNTSKVQSANKVTEYFALNFSTGNKKIRMVDGIKGRADAEALVEGIVRRCFGETQSRAA